MTNEQRLKDRSKIKFLWFWRSLFLPLQLIILITAIVIMSPFYLISKIIEFIDLVLS